MSSLSEKMPVIFVTGIGQTWSTISGDSRYRWNLIPTDKHLMFGSYTLKNCIDLAKAGAQSVFTLTTGKNHYRKDLTAEVAASLLSHCVVDEYGDLPFDVDLKIYGSRSFDKLRRIDFNTGKYCDEYEKSILKQIYHDIQCESLADRCGEENLYCFNYSPFSDIYANADKLHKMIKEVIADQKNKTGSNKVILVPMSMGASVVNAYIDRYYSDEKSDNVENLVDKIISIVGAWNGSDGLSDLILFNKSEKFYDNIFELVGSKTAGTLKNFSSEGVSLLLENIINGIVRGVILRNTSFMALVPKERYNEVINKLFTDSDNPVLKSVKEKSEMYYQAQCNLINRLVNMEKIYGVKSYFISGYNRRFGQKSRDFGFLSMFGSDENVNTDSVIQISSTAPGVKSAGTGKLTDNAGNMYVSPDGSVDASESPFRDRMWFFDNQYHEIGSNNTAINLACDIALGMVDSVDGIYPQFNSARDTGNINVIISNAEKIIEKGILPESEKENLEAAVSQVKSMLRNIHNNPVYDNAVMNRLIEEYNKILI